MYMFDMYWPYLFLAITPINYAFFLGVHFRVLGIATIYYNG